MHCDFSLASPRPLTRCPSLCTALEFPLFHAQRFVHSPAVHFPLLVVFPRCLYLIFPVRSAAFVPQTPPFGVPSSRPRQESGLGRSRCCGVGVRRILLSGYVGVSRTQGHRQPFLPSCQVGCAPACLLFSFALTHTPCQL